MLSVIVAFPKIEDANNLKKVLVRNGIEVSAVCTSGSQIIGMANELDYGIVICGYRFADMHYSVLHNYLPREFEMLLIASPTKFEDCINSAIVCLGMPIKIPDLLNTLQMMTYNYNRRWKKKKEKPKLPKQRTQEEKAIIEKAKLLLIDRNNMTEEEAHRYIQKTSMDKGLNMIEMAEMILEA